MSVEKKYDVVIVGAGVAGATAASLISRMGFSVALIDAKPSYRVGDKPCGDAIGKHHFEEVGIKPPSGEELDGLVKGILLYSPSEEVVLTIEGEGYEINRVKFTQRLIRESIDNGAEYYDETNASAPIIENGFVRGVIATRMGEKLVFRSNVVIDASGSARSIVRRLPPEWPVVDPIKPEDTQIAYREIRILEEWIDKPEYIRIYVNQKIAPGGYWWNFPKSIARTVNVGLGVQNGKGYEHPRTYLYKYILTRPEFKNSKIVETSGALVPTRRPPYSMVWNGIMVIGDAAYTVNPVHGGGKGSGMLAAKAASIAFAKASEIGDYSAKGLWIMNKLYIDYYGAKQASLDIFRIFLQKLSDDDIEYGLRKRILKESDLYETSITGVIKNKKSVFDKLGRVIAGLGRPSLLAKLIVAAEYMDKMKKLYEEYPDTPEKLSEWMYRVNSLYESFERALKE
ncbi:Chain A, Constructing Tailored Isoprenoid Products By Structure-guided Modification Of Geranylgeranyl Reductase [Desulfurococcaceae archaeon AG1]|nr:Chain A, Constructing Tailored Isoprenoid Products By Structure-guided Modification Of Geranylgeranyl Reductase [Desulfurococcaceae archaeon AG1]